MGKLLELISKIDPKRIQEYYPTKADYEEFVAAKELAARALASAERGLVNVAFLDDLDKATKALAAIAARLSARTELSSKARLNEAVYLAQAGLYERSIFLAGWAREHKMKEPYKTQIGLLPANACLQRYRQVYQVDEWIRANFENELNNRAAVTLAGMKDSFLHQMNYFATTTLQENPKHPMAMYMKVLADLLRAQAYKSAGNSEAAAQATSTAEAGANAIPSPTENDHYKALDYHRDNYIEFADFKRLSAANPIVTSILKARHDKADRIAREGGGIRPKEWFALVPYVTIGARAASVIGLVCLTASALGITADGVKAAVDHVWSTVTANVPGAGPMGLEMHDQGTLLAHTGGAARVLDTDIFKFVYASHTGGAA